MSTRTRLDLDQPCLAFLTTTVSGWTPVFIDSKIAEATLDQFGQAIKHYEASLVAYVLMPSHLHAAVGFASYRLIRKFMQSFKILSSKRAKEMIPPRFASEFFTDDAYRFCMPRYDELVITSRSRFQAKLEYIHNNPVKAGLVSRPESWPYSSAGAWLGGKPGVGEIDKSFGYLSND